jgi:hypothetical protein
VDDDECPEDQEEQDDGDDGLEDPHQAVPPTEPVA